jgi:hypothetical protein
MATDGSNQLRISATAGADLSTKQHFFVKFNAARQIILCGNNATLDIPCGVLTNNPKAGQIANVVCAGEVSVSANSALGTTLATPTWPAAIGSDVNGQAGYLPFTGATNFVAGQVMGDPTTGGTAGGLVTALVQCMSAGRNG